MLAAPIRPADHRDTEPAADWRAQGACRSLSAPDVMFPHPSDARGIVKAKAFCAACPVRTECASWALSTKEPHGVWGGLSEGDRDEMLRRRHRRPAGCGTDSGYKAHKARQEEACGECEAAHTKHMNRSWTEAVARAHEVGGTLAGARAHRLLHQAVCERCLNAERLEQYARRAAKSDRDKEIALARMGGMRPDAVAAKYGVTKSHVRRLVRRYKAAHGLTA